MMDHTSSEELILRMKGYKILKQLGEGSYAKVYLAEYKSTVTHEKAQLACKVIDTNKASLEFLKKFLPRELDILAKLNHPYIIHVHSVYLRRHKYFIFMRYAEEGDLLEYVTTRGAIAEPHARLWFRQMVLALQYLHDMDIAHRDLKCENALITHNFNIKIADFGFARFVVNDRKAPILSDTYCGSLSYAAPEVIRGRPYNPKISDVWSLGVILFVMLNKSMPFDDSHARRLYDLQMSRRWRLRSNVAEVVSDNLKKLVAFLLEPDIIKRYNCTQILGCSWIQMDPKLLVLNEAEQKARTHAALSKKFPRLDISKKPLDANTELTVLKEPSKTILQQSDELKNPATYKE